MSDLQDVFQRMKQKRKERSQLQAVYRDALANSKSFQEVSDELKKLQEKKRRIEQGIRSELTNELEKIERMKLDLNSDRILLNDLALNQLMQGQTIEVKDENEILYEPVFQVKFKKTDEIKK